MAHSPEFVRKALELYQKNNSNLSQTARQLGVAKSTLKSWVDTTEDFMENPDDFMKGTALEESEEKVARRLLLKAYDILNELQYHAPKDKAHLAGAVSKLIEKYQSLMGTETAQTVVMREFGRELDEDTIDTLLRNLGIAPLELGDGDEEE